MNITRVIEYSAAISLMTVLLAGCSATSGAGATTKVQRDFGGDARGRAASGMTSGETDGNGNPAIWVVEDDPTAPVGPAALVVRTVNLEKTYNFATLDAFSALDLTASVHVKALSGSDDQGGGLIWRFQDPRNYYLTRWNPLEKNIRLYVIVDGVRSKFGDCEVDAPPGWHKIDVSMRGSKIRVSFDAKVVIEAENAMINKPGKVGLWSKADATTAFDGLTVSSER